MIDDWTLWQLADSAFPSGSFAHSGGLEAAYQHGLVHDSESLNAYLREVYCQLEKGSLPIMEAAWDIPERFSEHDVRCDLYLNNHVANRASRAQGKAMLSSASTTFNLPTLQELAGIARQDGMPTHIAPVFGVCTRWLGAERERAVSLFLFTSIRGFISSAVRLGIIGALEAQTIQARFATSVGQNPGKSAPGQTLEPMQTSPWLDLLQGTQDRLYSRLFQS